MLSVQPFTSEANDHFVAVLTEKSLNLSMWQTPTLARASSRSASRVEPAPVRLDELRELLRQRGDDLTLAEESIKKIQDALDSEGQPLSLLDIRNAVKDYLRAVGSINELSLKLVDAASQAEQARVFYFENAGVIRASRGKQAKFFRLSMELRQLFLELAVSGQKTAEQCREWLEGSHVEELEELARAKLIGNSLDSSAKRHKNTLTILAAL